MVPDLPFDIIFKLSSNALNSISWALSTALHAFMFCTASTVGVKPGLVFESSENVVQHVHAVFSGTLTCRYQKVAQSEFTQSIDNPNTYHGRHI